MGLAVFVKCISCISLTYIYFSFKEKCSPNVLSVSKLHSSAIHIRHMHLFCTVLVVFAVSNKCRNENVEI